MAPTSHTKIEKILGNHPTIGLDPSAPIGSKKGLSLPWSCAFWASRPSQQCSGQSPKPPSCHSYRSTCTCLSWNCLASPQEDTPKSVQWPPCEQVAFGLFNRFFEVQLELPMAKSQTSTIINQLAQPAAGTRSLWKFDVEDDPLFPHPDPRSSPFPTPRSQRLAPDDRRPVVEEGSRHGDGFLRDTQAHQVFFFPWPPKQSSWVPKRPKLPLGRSCLSWDLDLG